MQKKGNKNNFDSGLIIYGMEDIMIYLLFAFMYRHALKKAKELELSDEEIYTKTKLYKNYILISIGLLLITVALLIAPANAASREWFIF